MDIQEQIQGDAGLRKVHFLIAILKCNHVYMLSIRNPEEDGEGDDTEKGSNL